MMCFTCSSRYSIIYWFMSHANSIAYFIIELLIDCAARIYLT